MEDDFAYESDEGYLSTAKKNAANKRKFEWDEDKYAKRNIKY